jgi:hypothetical protein
MSNETQTRFLLVESKVDFPINIEKKDMMERIKGLMSFYQDSFAEVSLGNYVKEDWRGNICEFKFKVNLFEGSGNIIVTAGEIRVKFFSHSKFYLEKEIREDFEKHIVLYMRLAMRKIIENKEIE